MFCLRNTKNIFQLRTFIWRPNHSTSVPDNYFLASIVDPDEMPHFVALNTALHFLQKYLLRGFYYKKQDCGNTMPDLSDLVPIHSGQVENFYLLVLGQVQIYV